VKSELILPGFSIIYDQLPAGLLLEGRNGRQIPSTTPFEGLKDRLFRPVVGAFPCP